MERSELLADSGCLPWLRVLQASTRVTQRIEHVLETRCDLSLAWYEVLFRLTSTLDGRLRMQDLARAVWLSNSGLTRLVSKMETVGLVERQLDLTDRRFTYAVITAAGKQAHQRAHPIYLHAVTEYFSRHLTADDAETLRRILEQVIRANGDIPLGSADPANQSNSESRDCEL
ncbi:MAG: MarR family transcriptional regulator [Roseiflexaceae bacterium]